MMSMLPKISKSPLLPEATFLLFAACVAQAQIAKIAVHFERQHQDGSVDINVSCSLTNVSGTYLESLTFGPCSIHSQARGNTSSSPKILASSDGRPRTAGQGIRSVRCEHQLRLVDTQISDGAMANRVGSGDNEKSMAGVPTVSSEEQLYCRISYLLCHSTWISAFSLRRSCRNPRPEWALSSPLSFTADGIRKNESVIRFGGNESVLAAAQSLHKNAVIQEDANRPNVCLLELRAITETMEGLWSCNPSEGQDGFILPSTALHMKVIDGCKSHSECPENQVCLNSTEKVPRRICGDPCHQEKGKQICGHVANSYCKVDKNTTAGMVCLCPSEYASDTGFENNRTRCLRQCITNWDCTADEATCITVRREGPGILEKRCFPICEVTKPQCGNGSVCRKTPPFHRRYTSWTRKCECEAGKFRNDLLSNSSLELCELPSFDGLHMIINGKDRQSCSTSSVANGTAHCQMLVTEGSLLNVTCEAPRVFPAANMELEFRRGNASIVDGNEADSPLKRPAPSDQHHQTHHLPGPTTIVENLQDKHGTRYRGEFPVMDVSVADHHDATFVCKLTSSPASTSTMIEMQLFVLPSPVGVATVAGSTAAATVGLIALVAILVIVATKCLRRGQQKQGVSSGARNTKCYSVSHDRGRDSVNIAAKREEDELDDMVYEDVTEHLQRNPDGQASITSPAVANPAYEPLYANCKNSYEPEGDYF